MLLQLLETCFLVTLLVSTNPLNSEASLINDFIYLIILVPSGRRGVLIVAGFRSKGLELKFYLSTVDIRQEGHPEFKVLQCFTKKPGLKVSG